MPFVSKLYEGYIEDGNSVKQRTLQGFNNATYNVTYVIDTLSKFFYDCVKDLFQTQVELPVIFDDEEMTMNFNGVTMYLMAHRSYNGNVGDIRNDNNWYCNFPNVYIKNYGRCENALYTLPHYNHNAVTADFNVQEMSIVESSLDNKWNHVYFKLNVYYNTNFIYMTYGGFHNIESQFPIISMIFGKTIDDQEIVYFHKDMNVTYYARDNYYYHQMILKEHLVNGTVRYTDNSNTNIIPGYQCFEMLCSYDEQSEYVGFMETIKDRTKMYTRYLKDETCKKLLLRKPMMLGGTVNFDNLYIIPKTWERATFFEIDGETYAHPMTQMYQRQMNTNQASFWYRNKFLFKL